MSIFSAIIVFVLLVFLLTMVLANAAPWVPTRRRDMERILALARIKPGEVFYDLGCGDGRLLVAAARAGAKAEGLDISLLSYLMSLLRTKLERSKARVHFKNLFRQNLSSADIVYLFLMPAALPKIKNKFDAELKKGARVLSYSFPIPGLTPKTIDKRPDSQTIYLYEI
jgi:SAM-dependent methyltransferase